MKMAKRSETGRKIRLIAIYADYISLFFCYYLNFQYKQYLYIKDVLLNQMLCYLNLLSQLFNSHILP